MAERTKRKESAVQYDMGSTLPCGHTIDYSDPNSPFLKRRKLLTGLFYCPQCKKEEWLPCAYRLSVRKDPEADNEEWTPPSVERFLKAEPTKEEKKKHEEIKETMSPVQKGAAEKLGEVFEDTGGAFILCDEKDSQEDFQDVLNFLVSDYANQGEGEFKQRRNRAIPVLRLCKADFDASLDHEYESEKGELHIKGGFNYHEPSREWLRVGLNVRGKYEDDKWMGESGEEGEWIVAYHGSKTLSGNQSIAESQTFTTKGNRQLHEDDIDVNPRSTRYNKPCGQGAYFACSIDVASGYAKEKMGEKCVFVVRLNPTGTRVPEKETGYAIVNDSENARPVGICIRRTVVEEKCTLM